ncbi:M48 family metallopeptidase [Rhizohabitans arisaemae]|uniref:M48 family metallopeptidase n=1 Tax=Rhizohabitans arisaemae TaxID=2720610 RepID=UPI0024B1765E|nr:M48 family metallopeptidase [Rhizohabitans arisaemae]
MRSRAWAGLTVLGAALAAVIVFTTPWSALSAEPAPLAEYFTPEEIARSRAFDAAVNVPGYLSLALTLVFAVLLVVTPWGGRLMRRLPGPWAVQVLIGVVLVELVLRLITLPFSAWGETVLRHYGLSVQDWGSWLLDKAKGFAINTVLVAVLVLALVALARRFPRSWWIPAALGGAALTVLVSFVYPVVVEPVYNDFKPMAAGQLRSDLLDLARKDGVPVEDVLVADASRRTTALNAYVSGFGATRRIVVYDTLLKGATPEEIKLIAAHELGHAKENDVLAGTLVAALATAFGACLIFLLVPALKVESVPLLLGLFILFNTLSAPVQNLVSRRIEARADVHALDLTREPASFVAMQRRLAVKNISDLSPDALEYLLYSSHPTAVQRIGIARSWAARNGLPVP